MIKTEKWINRTAVAMLSTAVSVTAFAAAPGAPDFLVHKANVKFKVSSQGAGEIDKDTIKTQNVINALMGRDIDDDGDNSETLGMVTACDADIDSVALIVYDKNDNTVVSDPSNAIVLDIAAAATEVKDNGDPKKTDLLAGLEEGEAFLTATGTVKYGAIGKGVADDDNWDRDAVCAKNFSSKSVDGIGLFGEVVMSGKISANKPDFAADFPDGVYPGGRVAITKTAVEINGDPDQEAVEAADDVISYEVLVENVGDIDLTTVTVSDPDTDDTLNCAGQGTNVVSLVPGESVVCTGDRTVTAQEINDACGVSIEPPGPLDTVIANIAGVTSDQTNLVATVEVVDIDCPDDGPGSGGDMAITKAATAVTCGTCGGDLEGTVGEAGDTIDYEITVINLTDAALTNVTVTDTRIPEADLDCGDFDGSLEAAGGADTATCTATYTVTEDDIDVACEDRDGTIYNIAVTTADGLNNFAADELVPVACGGDVTPN